MRALIWSLPVQVLLALAPGWSAAQNSVTVPMEVEHNSNPALVPGGGSVLRYRLSPQFTMSRQSGSTRSVFSLGGVVERSSDTRVSAHRSDPNISYLLELTDPTSVWTLNASVTESSSRATEFEETGVVTADGTLRTGLLGARWARQINERTGLELAAGYADLDYETPVLIGYTEVNAEGLVRWQLAEGNRLELVGTAARLSPENDTVRSSRQGIMLGYETLVSPGFTVGAGLGSARTTGVRRGSDAVGELRLAFEGERLDTGLEWSREVAPSGTIGGYSLSQVLRWELSYALTESTSLLSGASRTRTLALDGGSGSTVSVGMRTELSSFWSMNLRLERVRATTATGTAARSNAVGVGFVYSHPDL